MYDPVPHGISKLQQVKVEIKIFYLVNLDIFNFDMPYFQCPLLGQGHKFLIRKLSDIVNVSKEDICQDVLKNTNLLHKQAFVDSQMKGCKYYIFFHT